MMKDESADEQRLGYALSPKTQVRHAHGRPQPGYASMPVHALMIVVGWLYKSTSTQSYEFTLCPKSVLHKLCHIPAEVPDCATSSRGQQQSHVEDQLEQRW